MTEYDEDVRLMEGRLSETGRDNPLRATALNDLAVALHSRYDETRNLDDIGRAVDNYDEAVKLLPPDSPKRSEYIYELATALQDLFEVDECPATLDRAIGAFEDSIVSAEETQDPDCYLSLHGLGNALEDRIRIRKVAAGVEKSDHPNTKQYTREDVNRAINVYTQACDRSPLDAIDRPIYYNNLGGIYVERFEMDGDPQDLDQAECAYSEAIEIARGRGKRPALYLHNLAYALHSRSELNNSDSDLNSSLDLFAEAVKLADNDHQRATFSQDYANALQLQFRRTGRTESLNSAISYYREAINLCDSEDSQSAYARNNLGNALQRRYSWTGSSDDLKGAIEQYETLQKCCPEFSRTPRFLTGFGLAKRRLFQHDDTKSNLRYLDEAINLFTLALDYTPPGHGDRSMCVANLGIALLDRFEETPSDGFLLDRARDLYQEALIHKSDMEGDPDRGRLYHNLGLVLFKKFENERVIGLLNDAISSYKEAVQCTPSIQPEHAIYLISLGEGLKSYYDHSYPRNPEYLEKSSRVFQAACESPTANPSTRIVAAIYLVQQLVESDSGYQIANRALQIAVPLLLSTASYNLRRVDQQYNLTAYSGLASTAAAIALQAGESVDNAACLLEAGRGVILGHIMDLRLQVMNLRDDLAERYLSLTTTLDPEFPPSNDMAEEQIDERQRAALLLDQLMEEIRNEPGFEDFGRILTPQDLMDVASKGDGAPIVLINVSHYRCDAFIITASSISRRHLDVTMSTIKEKLDIFSSNIELSAEAYKRQNNVEAERAESCILGVLEWLWDAITEPILLDLGFLPHKFVTTYDAWPKIWWCPTGLLSYLPLHAAGYHRQAQDKSVMDRVVSAYTPTIRALKQARTKFNSVLSTNSAKILIAAKESSPGYARLPLARDEAYCIERTIVDQGVFLEKDVEVDESPTVDKVCRQLCETAIVHFACHAYISADVSDSGIVLDEKLSTEAVSRARVPSGALAYLSACNTAMSKASHLLDECITLCSAFQVAGFARVIGTLWKSEDSASFEIAKVFYQAMASNTSTAQVSLHKAILSQRAQYGDQPSLWAGYIYSGI